MNGSDPALTALELAAGFPIGGSVASGRSAGAAAASPRAALESAVLPAVARPPCVVSFSGGRDSSAVLALATAVARREGLPDPVPVTLRFPDAPAADEREWQELVIGHLGLGDWQRVELTDELDLVGPVASAVLHRHGLLWPPNTHFHQPILERAAGGSVLTGIDGDGLFGTWRWRRLGQVLSRRRAPRPADAGRLLLALSPPGLRRQVDGRRLSDPIPWLQPTAVAELQRRRARETAGEPARWDRWLRWYAGQRSLVLTLDGFRRIAEDAGVLDVHPFADPAVLDALGRAGGRRGLGDRTAAMGWLAGDLLPEVVIARRSKARLSAPFWNRSSRAFIDSWDGTGVDADLVDTDALRREWAKDLPHACSSSLLQAAWLAAGAGA